MSSHPHPRADPTLKLPYRCSSLYESPTAAHHYRLPGPPGDVDLAVAPSCVGHDGAGRRARIVAVRRELLPRPGDNDLWREGRAQRP
jgi:hypothetical protein